MDAEDSTVAKPEIVSPEEWTRARAELLAAEKQVTRAEDAVAARRRRLPMVRFRNDYAFASPSGPVTLLDLFQGRSQLLLYQFMDNGPDDFCPGCTWFTHGVPPHRSIGWRTPTSAGRRCPTCRWSRCGATGRRWAGQSPFASSNGTTFSADIGAGGGFLLNVFLRVGDELYRTYSTTQRGVDRLVFTNSIRDLLPYGRQEA